MVDERHDGGNHAEIKRLIRDAVLVGLRHLLFRWGNLGLLQFLAVEEVQLSLADELLERNAGV